MLSQHLGMSHTHTHTQRALADVPVGLFHCLPCVFMTQSDVLFLSCVCVFMTQSDVLFLSCVLPPSASTVEKTGTTLSNARYVKEQPLQPLQGHPALWGTCRSTAPSRSLSPLKVIQPCGEPASLLHWTDQHPPQVCIHNSVIHTYLASKFTVLICPSVVLVL